MGAQRRQLAPCLTCVGGGEQCCVFSARIKHVGILERRLDVPDALELPRVRRAVVPGVRPGRAFVQELVAAGLPCLAAVVGALEHLAEPPARLRRVDPVRVRRRALHVVDLPAGKVRTLDLPALAAGVGGQDERALARPDEYSNAAHGVTPRSKMPAYVN